MAVLNILHGRLTSAAGPSLGACMLQTGVSIACYIVNNGLGEEDPALTTLVNTVLNQNGEGLVFTLPVSVDSSNLDGHDPRFVAAACEDFRLRSDSPLLNRGTNDAPDLPETDQLGAPRINDGAVDLGALEFTGTVTDELCAQGPDLNGTLTKVNVKAKDAGNVLTVKLEVCNVGIDPIADAFDLALYLSDSARIATDAVAMQTFAIDTLAAGECRQTEKKERRFKVKKLGPLDGRFVLVVIDDGNRIDEASEDNNLLVRQIEIAP